MRSIRPAIFLTLAFLVGASAPAFAKDPRPKNKRTTAAERRMDALRQRGGAMRMPGVSMPLDHVKDIQATRDHKVAVTYRSGATHIYPSLTIAPNETSKERVVLSHTQLRRITGLAPGKPSRGQQRLDHRLTSLARMAGASAYQGLMFDSPRGARWSMDMIAGIRVVGDTIEVKIGSTARKPMRLASLRISDGRGVAQGEALSPAQVRAVLAR